MARFAPLFSGSSGNCVAVGSREHYILIDAGVSAKRIRDALLMRGFDPAGLAAVFVTHEHTDHVTGLRVLTSRGNVPVYATAGTLCALDPMGHLAGVSASACPWEGVEAAGMQVTPFRTSHDTIESCAYVIATADGRRIAVMTDTGVVSGEMRAAVTGCDLVYIESNHDVEMLRNGPYPFPLRQRILSSRGHLSNAQCAAELPSLLRNGASRFFLAHISRENNLPELALRSARAALDETGAKAERDYTLQAVPPDGLPVTIF